MRTLAIILLVLTDEIKSVVYTKVHFFLNVTHGLCGAVGSPDYLLLRL